MTKMMLDDLDMARLIRSQIGEQGKTIAEVARAVFERREGLNNVLSGTSRLSPVGFLKLIKLLQVKGGLLKLWVAAFLVSRHKDFLPIVRELGLTAGAPPKAVEPIKESEAWKSYSRTEETGKRRYAISRLLAKTPEMQSSAIAGALQLTPMLVRSSLHDLSEQGLVSRKEVRAEVEGMKAVHKATVSLWSLTQDGVFKLQRSESR